MAWRSVSSASGDRFDGCAARFACRSWASPRHGGAVVPGSGGLPQRAGPHGHRRSRIAAKTEHYIVVVRRCHDLRGRIRSPRGNGNASPAEPPSKFPASARRVRRGQAPDRVERQGRPGCEKSSRSRQGAASYELFACNGILFNHESPLRGETFDTRKITRGLAGNGARGPPHHATRRAGRAARSRRTQAR